MTSNPLSRFVWTRHGDVIETSGRFVVNPWDVDEYTKRLDLIVKEVAAEDLGPYTCVAENYLGVSNATVQLFGKH